MFKCKLEANQEERTVTAEMNNANAHHCLWPTPGIN